MKGKSLVFFLTPGTKIPRFISLQDLNIVKKRKKQFIILKIKKANFGPIPSGLVVKMPGSSLYRLAFYFENTLRVEDAQKRILWKNFYYCENCHANSAIPDGIWKNGKRNTKCVKCGKRWETQLYQI